MRRFVASIAGGLPTTFWYLWAGTLVNRVGGFVVPFLALYLTGVRGVPVASAGVIISLYGAGSLCAGLAGGYLADRVGRKVTLVAGLVLGAFAMLALGFARDFAVLGLANFCVGFFSDLARPASAATVSDVVPAGDRPRAFALLYWAANLGFSISPLVAGFLASRSYFALFAGDAATTLAFGLLAWRKVPETRPAEAAARSQGSGLRGLAVPLSDPAFLPFGVLVTALAMIFFQFQVALPVDMRDHGIPPERYGALIAINGIMIVCLQPFATRWLARFRRSSVLAGAALLTGVGFSLPALVSVPSIYAASIAVWTLGEILHSPMPPSVVADLAPVSLRGAYQGALQVCWGVAFLVAPAIGSRILGLYGARALWLGCFCAGVLVALGHLAIAQGRRRRIAALRAQAPVGQVGVWED